MEPTKQQIYNAYKKLPEHVQKYIVSVEAADDMATLGTHKSLTSEQISKLAKQSGFFLMNIVPPDALAGNIEYELNIDESLAETLAAYIKEVIKPKSAGYQEVIEPVKEEITKPVEKEMTAPVIEQPIKEEKPAPMTAPAEPAVFTPLEPRPVPIKRIFPDTPVNIPAAPQPEDIVPPPKEEVLVPEEQEPAPYKLDASLPSIHDNLPMVMHEEREVALIHEEPKATPEPVTPLPPPSVPETKQEQVAPIVEPKVAPVIQNPAPSIPATPPEPVAETPIIPKVTRASIVDAHLHGSFGMPKKEIDVTPPAEKPKPKYDPYREPIE